MKKRLNKKASAQKEVDPEISANYMVKEKANCKAC